MRRRGARGREREREEREGEGGERGRGKGSQGNVSSGGAGVIRLIRGAADSISSEGWCVRSWPPFVIFYKRAGQLFEVLIFS